MIVIPNRLPWAQCNKLPKTDVTKASEQSDQDRGTDAIVLSLGQESIDLDPEVANRIRHFG